MISRISGRVVSVLRGARDGQAGQSLPVIILSMAVIIAIAAFAIDVASWYAKHHQTQVAADSAALAAANCLANGAKGQGPCSSATDYTEATTIAVRYANDNGISITSSDVTFGNARVTVNAQATSPAWFSRLFGIKNGVVGAAAEASSTWSASSTCVTSGASNCLSFFAGNTTCPSSDTEVSGTTEGTTEATLPSETAGLVLVVNDSGGGQSQVLDAETNAYIYNGGHSGASIFNVLQPPGCTNSLVNPKNTYITSSPVQPYPETWVQPKSGYGCDQIGDYLTTNATTNGAPTPSKDLISGPGTYCVAQSDTTKPVTTPCTQDASGVAGSIYVNEASSSLTAGGAYEFVGPCATFSNASTPVITNPPGQPLFFGTKNIVKPASPDPNALPTCTDDANDGTTGTDVWIDGNGAQIGAPIFDQCGTVELTQNNNFLGFIEAWNIILDKNNTSTGNGPQSGSGGGTITSSDKLVG